MKITKEQLKQIIKEELKNVLEGQSEMLNDPSFIDPSHSMRRQSAEPERSEWQEKARDRKGQPLEGWQFDLVGALPKYAEDKYPDHSLNLQPLEFNDLVANFLESDAVPESVTVMDIGIDEIKRLWSDIKSVTHDEYGSVFRLHPRFLGSK